MLKFPSVGYPTHPQLHIKTTMARLDPYFRFSQLHVEVKRNGYKMSFTPASLEIDNSPYFDSVGLKSIGTLTEDFAAEARQTALEATADACRKGDALAEGASVGSLAMMQLTRSIDRMLTCVQPSPPEISCKKADLNISYAKDEYSFSWDTGGAGASCTPYSLEMWVSFQDKAGMER